MEIVSGGGKYNKPSKFVLAIHDARIRVEMVEDAARAKAESDQRARESSIFGRLLG